MRQIGLVVVLAAALTGAACTQNTKDYPAGQSPAEINVELGLHYMREGQKSVAMEKFQKALEQDPDLAAAHSGIAVLYESLGETAKADQHFRRAVSLNPKDSRAHNNYGAFLCSNDRWPEAEKQFLLAADNPLYDAPHMAFTNAGICAYGVKDVAKAERYWRRALELNPRYPAALLQMARLGVEQKEYLSARAYLQRLHEVVRPSAESLWLGIQTERALGDRNAEASYTLLLKNSFPQSPQARQLQGKAADE